MINSNYKKYIGYITAGLFGVLLVVGLRGASAATQTSLPSSNVTPNFSGLNISGSVDVGGGVNVGSVVTAPQLNTEAIGDQGGDGIIDIEAGITVEDSISNKFDDALVIDDGLEVKGQLDVQGNIKNSKGTVIISSPLEMEGVPAFNEQTGLKQYSLMIKQGQFKIDGGIIGKEAYIDGTTNITGVTTINNKLNINAPDVAGNALNITGGVGINGALRGNKDDTSPAGTLYIDSGGGVQITGPMQVGSADGTQYSNGKTSQLTDFSASGDSIPFLTVKGGAKITHDLDVMGNINGTSVQITGKASFLGDIEFAKPLQLTSELQNIAGDVIINDNLDVRDEIVNNDGTNLIRIGKGNQPTKLDVTGAFSAPAATFSQDVTVNAKFKANQIGKFTINTSAKKTLFAGQTSPITSSCPTTPNKAKIISCGFAQETTNSDVYLLELKPESFNTGDDCIAKAVNKGTGTKYGYGYAVCFDPKSN